MRYFALIFFAMPIVGCGKKSESEYSLAVIDGDPVKNPNEAPGTYGVQYFSNGNYAGGASAVAIGPNAFITNGHVVDGPSGAQLNLVRIVDYRGNLVKEFNPGDTASVQKIVNPKFYDKDPLVRDSNDVGAFVFKDNISVEKFTQGFLPVSANGLSKGGEVTLVGNGISDYRVLENRQKYVGDNSGTLRWGSNTIADTGAGGGYINGFAFRNMVGDGQSVSGPGDSGGSVTTKDKNGIPQLAGLMQSGGLFKSGENGNQYFDYNKNPEQISAQPNSAYSYIVDLTQQQSFLQQVQENGGNVSIPTFSNPNTRQNYDSSEVASMQEQYGDAWKGAAIVRSSDGLNYSGYSGGGEYKYEGDQGYQWFKNDGSASGYYMKSEGGEWKGSQVNQPVPQNTVPVSASSL